MTATPESWDDVGCLRLQVECISQKIQKVEDVQQGMTAFNSLSDWQLQKLKDEVVLLAAKENQKNERCQTRAILFGCFLCSTVTAVLFGCVLTLQVFIINQMYAGSGPRLFQRLSNEVMKLNDFSTSMASTLVQAEQAIQGKQGNSSNDEKVGHKLREIADTKIEKVLSGHSRQEQALKLSTVWKVLADDDKSPEQTQDSQVAPLLETASNKGLRQSSRVMFYVCFPSSAHEQYVKKFTSVFNEVARKSKWTVYPFCHLDIRKAGDWNEHLCNDAKKITFVLKTSRNVTSSEYMEVPSDVEFDDYLSMYNWFPEWFSFESPMWFRRMYRPDQNIRVAEIEEFLNDVYSGKLQEVAPQKIPKSAYEKPMTSTWATRDL
eukprot:gnl/MRDRNA2_/MRDRNA2_130343_c0_seq1.p1 gnl/MRDRNA2_/MRDRNA2_130343_c0~~gnl/MRDRNA2_/MRDRNA2_130343_c0_seq1.p1  ORF type:complete len:418 (-),score=76.81 gnl/MRDRNA2_/MRDRNA2_130343_c0_seq1:11-1141(-)